MGVTYKMGADVSGFKQGMQQAQQSVKTLDAQLKLNEKQLKANGDAELYMSNKAKLLDQQLEAQRKVVSGLYKQLDEMKKRGVDETSEAYQKLERSIYNAAGKMMDIQAEINSLTNSEQKAAAGASTMEQNLSSINKKVSFEAVIKGVDSITNGLEKAAQTAIKVGEAIWDNIMDSAAYADDTATLATRMGLTVEEVQQMQYVANRFEAPVETVAKVWKKVKTSMASDSEEVQDAFAQLGVSLRDITGYGIYGDAIGAMRDYRDVFWDTGEALMNMTDESERERLAQKLLGRSWDEMAVMFTKGRDAYEAAMEAAPTNSEEAINNAAELNDRVSELEQSFLILKTEVIGSIAPALSDAAKVLQELMDSITEYLKKDEGQAMLKRLGDAVSGLFEDLKNIDPEDVVNNFVSLFESLVSAFEWVDENWDAVKIGLESIVGVFIAGKAISGVTQWLSLINGLKTFGKSGGGTPTESPTTGTGSGGSGGETAAGTGLFAKAKTAISGFVAEIIPFVAGEAAVISAALAPAVLAQTDVENKILEEYANAEAVAQAAEKAGLDAGKLRTLNNATLANGTDRNGLGFLNLNDTEQAAMVLQALSDPMKRGQLYADIQKYGGDLSAGGNSLWTALLRHWGEYREWQYDDPTTYKNEEGEVRVDSPLTQMEVNELVEALREVEIRKLEDQQAKTAESMQEATEAMKTLPQQMVTAMENANITVVISGSEKANGLFSVPWDGYPAILHKGERVLPARDVERNTYNTYFGNVNLHNGLEVDALAESIDRNNRRKRAGYGAA